MDGGDVGSPFLDRLTSRVTGVGLMPVLHCSLAEPPAEKYTPSLTLAREVHEARVEGEAVLDPEVADLADARVYLRGYLLSLPFELRGARIRLIQSAPPALISISVTRSRHLG